MELVIDHISKRNQQIDKLEEVLLTNFPVIDAPIIDCFADGIYTREMIGPADSFIVSEIHKTDHIFHLMQGTLTVFDGENDGVVVQAPFRGITKAGTRRWAYIWPFEDVRWVTIHANPNNENVEQIRERIIEKHTNPLITDELKEKMLEVKHYVKTISITQLIENQ